MVTFPIKEHFVKLRHFTAAEFGWSYPFLSVGLLYKLDEFRERLGVPVIVSPASGSTLRIFPKDEADQSQHLFGRAIDVMIPWTGITLKEAAEIAEDVGFTGIGVYPGWLPYKGMHLDVRPKPTVAKWAGLRDASGKQYYTTIEQGFTA